MTIKIILGFVLGFIVIAALFDASSTSQKPGTTSAMVGSPPTPKANTRVAPPQTISKAPDTTRDNFERDMKRAQKNLNECLDDIRSGISNMKRESIACDRNAGRYK